MKFTGPSGAVFALLATLWACGDSGATASLGQDEAALATAVAATEDDNAATGTDPLGVEPFWVKGCGFGSIVSQLRERFDVDGSGDLSEEEQAAISAEFGAPADRVALLLSIYDSDSSGALDAAELAAVQADVEARCQEREAALLEQFDADGDGALSDTERQAARDALVSRFGGGRGRRGGRVDVDSGEQRGGAARPERRGRVEAEFDRDGDGRLGGAEHVAFGEHMRGCVRGEHPLDPVPVPATPDDGGDDAPPPAPTPPPDPEPTPDPTSPSDEPVATPDEPGVTPDAGAIGPR